VTTHQQQKKSAEVLAYEKQQAAIKAQRKLEAEARPDPIHRAVIFLLRQAMQNNRDCRNEAQDYIEVLDSSFAEPEKLAEIENPPAAPQLPAENSTAGQDGESSTAAEPAAEAPPVVKQSRRFRR